MAALVSQPSPQLGEVGILTLLLLRTMGSEELSHALRLHCGKEAISVLLFQTPSSLL